jgi:hypothetical protein
MPQGRHGSKRRLGRRPGQNRVHAADDAALRFAAAERVVRRKVERACGGLAAVSSTVASREVKQRAIARLLSAVPASEHGKILHGPAQRLEKVGYRRLGEKLRAVMPVTSPVVSLAGVRDNMSDALIEDDTQLPTQQDILRLLRMLRPHDAMGLPKTRVGSPADGGYVLNDDLRGLNGLLSIGIGNDVSFDLAFAQQGVQVYQYDPTVEGPPVVHSRFCFRKLGLAQADGQEMRSVASMLAENGLAGCRDLLLKFDVEGAEWGALDGVLVLEHFRQIVGEFHFLEKLEQDGFFEQAWRVFERLTRHHIVTHLHANSATGAHIVQGMLMPRLLEITFLRRDRSTFAPSHDPIPSPIDRPNMLGQPEIILSPFGF